MSKGNRTTIAITNGTFKRLDALKQMKKGFNVLERRESADDVISRLMDEHNMNSLLESYCTVSHNNKNGVTVNERLEGSKKQAG